jgi:histidinol-phosphate aminotransferase
MHRSKSRAASNVQRVEGVIDLGGVIPAFAPPVAVSEAMTQTVEGNEHLYEVLLRNRLATEYRLNERNLALLSDIDTALAGIVARTVGPLNLFPPSATYGSLRSALQHREVVEIARGLGRDSTIPLESASDLAHEGVAIIASPGDPLGNVLVANDAVRLARSCQWLIIDERYADYAGQSLLNVASEFPNVIVLRSFQARLGATHANAGWVVGSRGARDLLAAVASQLPSGIAQAALTAYSGTTSSRMLLSLVRDERSRLFRALRKLSYLQPLPSWGPFVAARVEVGNRETLLALLSDRGINVHVPEEPGLERYLRIGIGTRSAMEHLRCSLLEIAPAMLGAELASGDCDSYRLTLRGEEFSQAEFRQVKQRGQRSA